jgi:ribose transport system permease protein
MIKNPIDRVAGQAEEPFLIGPAVQYLRMNGGILIAFVLLFTIMSVAAENFFSTANFLNVLESS